MLLRTCHLFDIKNAQSVVCAKWMFDTLCLLDQPNLADRQNNKNKLGRGERRRERGISLCD